MGGGVLLALRNEGNIWYKTPRMFNHGWWRLGVGGWWLAVAVGGGWWRLAAAIKGGH